MKRELPTMIALAERVLAAGVPGIVATLFSSQGSTYRALGSMMVGLPGLHAGGVSGGCLESHVAQRGCTVTREHDAAVLGFRTDEDAEEGAPVLGCGRSIEVLVERLTAKHVGLLRDIAAAYDADHASMLVTRLELAGDEVRIDRRWISGPGDGGPTHLVTLAREVRQHRASRHTRLDAAHAALVSYVPPVTRLIVFGAGDDVMPVSVLASSLGWHVTIADRRARLATPARFPNAEVVLSGAWEQLMAGITFTSSTVALLMTHSLPDDALVTALLAGRELAYAGVLGPARRRQLVLEEAAAHNPSSSSSLAVHMRGPIGLDLGGRAAPEIAVSIVAEVLAWMNERDARPFSDRSSRLAGL